MLCQLDNHALDSVYYASFTRLFASNISMRKTSHTALYGNIAIPRAYCSECSTYAFVIDGELKCCDSPYDLGETSRVKRMSDCPAKRGTPSKKWQKHILAEQEHRCFYCNRRFGKTVYRRSRDLRLKLHWDHVNPYAYSLDNRTQNFVAACHVW